jgi:hypothetical protein
MVDLLETAAWYGTRLVVPGSKEEVEEVANPFETAGEFDQLVEQWVPLTLLLNSLNRSLGQDDAYPFALTAGALQKLRFVHDLIQSPKPQGTGLGAAASTPAVPGSKPTGQSAAQA